MITSRYITEGDRKLLSTSLILDEYHSDTPVSFFYEDGTVCSVYEDEEGPICFVRGKPLLYEGIGVIQLDIQYLNNMDAKRNLKAMIDGFPIMESRAKENGFSGFFFMSSAQLLRKFCIKRLGFQEYNDDVLVKVLVDEVPRDVI